MNKAAVVRAAARKVRRPAPKSARLWAMRAWGDRGDWAVLVISRGTLGLKRRRTG
ncbi:hypothetical protein AZA_23103 [Nitrospirillum viridazoti Y2]|nr:hypothetical protein AZA_23103 [Nitrospirillum amazonense Y2]